MTITLTLRNVEQLVFYDKKVQQILPELETTFAKWTLGTRAGVGSIAKDALLDFLNTVSSEHLDRLSGHWGAPVRITRIDPSLVRNASVPLADVCEYLGGLDESNWNISIARSGGHCYISCWR